MLFPRESLLQEAHAFLSRPGENQVGAEEALSPDLAGLPPVSYTHLDVYKRQIIAFSE